MRRAPRLVASASDGNQPGKSHEANPATWRFVDRGERCAHYHSHHRLERSTWFQRHARATQDRRRFCRTDVGLDVHSQRIGVEEQESRAQFSQHAFGPGLLHHSHRAGRSVQLRRKRSGPVQRRFRGDQDGARFGGFAHAHSRQCRPHGVRSDARDRNTRRQCVRDWRKWYWSAPCRQHDRTHAHLLSGRPDARVPILLKAARTCDVGDERSFGATRRLFAMKAAPDIDLIISASNRRLGGSTGPFA